MRVERIEDLVVGHSGYYYCRVRLNIVGTDHHVIWLISEHPNAEWVWRGPIDSFGDREDLVGRTFLFPLRHDEWQGRTYEKAGRIGEELPDE